MKLYKYVRPDVVPKMFGDGETVLLKCSPPSEFNDPYELFLTVDFNIEPILLAFYEDLVGEMVQTPTACFSRAPDVVPMWAHYGSEGQGAVIELDEDCIRAAYPEIRLDDVEYRDGADPALTMALRHAAGTLKFRHADQLQGAILWAAYFTKSSAWSYERERRVVVPNAKYLQSRQGGRFLVIQKGCVTGLIVGPGASEEVRDLLGRRAAIMGCAYYETVIGRLTTRPYFESATGPCVFAGDLLVEADHVCQGCREPLGGAGDRCSWCSIGDLEREAAAADNPLRLLANLGLLDSYRSEVARIAAESSAEDNDELIGG